MSIIGISSESLSVEEFIKYVENLGYTIVSEPYILKIKTKIGWIEFKVIDVMNPTNGIGKTLAHKYNSPSLEGPIIHGEVSAGLWEEAVRIFYPNSEYEDVAIMIHDNFINIKIPTKNVDGLHGEILIHGRSFKLPLNTEDLEVITNLGNEALKTLERAILAYGLKSMISSETLSECIKKNEFKSEEIDFNSGFVVIKEDNGVSVVSIVDYVVKLVIDGYVDKAYNVYERLNEDRKREIVEILKDELVIYEKTGKRRGYNNISAFMQKLNEQKL